MFKEEVRKDPNFATKKNFIPFPEHDANKILFFINSPEFIKEEWLFHMMQFALGTQFGFCGCSEHHDITWEHISFGNYLPDCQFFGQQYVKLSKALITKNNQVTIGKSFCFFFKY